MLSQFPVAIAPTLIAYLKFAKVRGLHETVGTHGETSNIGAPDQEPRQEWASCDSAKR
jgi:hypothetical protein